MTRCARHPNVVQPGWNDGFEALRGSVCCSAYAHALNGWDVTQVRRCVPVTEVHGLLSGDLVVVDSTVGRCLARVGLVKDNQAIAYTSVHTFMLEHIEGRWLCVGLFARGVVPELDLGRDTEAKKES